jgi:hypothetical protein
VAVDPANNGNLSSRYIQFNPTPRMEHMLSSTYTKLTMIIGTEFQYTQCVVSSLLGYGNSFFFLAFIVVRTCTIRFTFGGGEEGSRYQWGWGRYKERA